MMQADVVVRRAHIALHFTHMCPNPLPLRMQTNVESRCSDVRARCMQIVREPSRPAGRAAEVLHHPDPHARRAQLRPVRAARGRAVRQIPAGCQTVSGAHGSNANRWLMTMHHNGTQRTHTLSYPCV